MHSFEEKLDPSDVNGTMDYGLWPLAFGLWPLAFGLWLAREARFEIFPTRFHMRIQFSYIYSYTCKCVFCKPELSVLRFAPARIYISSDEYIYYFSPRQVPSAYPVLIFIFLLNVN